jgi:hypothetical protein
VDLVDGARHYVDKHLWESLDGMLAWLDAFAQDTVKTTTFWRLDTYNCQRVYKSDSFIADLYPKLEQSWNQVTQFKQDRTLYDAFMQTSSKKNSAFGKQVIEVATDTTHKQKAVGGAKKFIGYSFIDDAIDDAI